MSGTYVEISFNEFDDFIKSHGFQQVKLEGVTECVYGKRFGDITIRVYSSIIQDAVSRKCGKDAIRVALFWRDSQYIKNCECEGKVIYKDNKFICTKCRKEQDPKVAMPVIPVGSQKRVHRTAGWKKNLLKRIDEAAAEKLETCHCGRPMVLRHNRKDQSQFWGCVGYVVGACKGTKPYIIEEE